jgi:hypothetical protein
MTVEARKAALQRKHATIEAQLQSMSSNPSADEKEERELKREKLRLKDEIARLGG